MPPLHSGFAQFGQSWSKLLDICNDFDYFAFMTLDAANLSRVHHLAHRLEQDIARRGLRTGEEYLTAEAAAEMLGVSRMTANRAMNVLARRKVLMRYRSRGSFVGSAVTPQPAADVCSIHLLTFVDDNPGLQIPAGRMLLGLHESLPAANLQIHTIPLQGRWSA